MNKKIEKIIYPGKSLIREEKIILTDEGLPGETVKISITKEKSNLSEAVTTDIEKPSAERTAPRCQHYKICSNYQYIKYEAQAAIKQGQLKEIFAKTAPGITIDFVPAKKTYGYRNKANFLIKQIDKNKLSLAYNNVNDPFSFTPIDSCALIDETLQGIAADTVKILNLNKITCINDITLRYTTIGSTMLILHAVNMPALDWAKIFAPLYEKYKASIVYEVSGKITAICGKDQIKEKAHNCTFTYGPLSFFQINHEMLEVILDDLAKILPISSKTVVADLYCGVGTFAVALAKKAAKVIMVESAIENTKFMETNIRDNKLTNAQTYFGDINRWLKKLTDQNIDIALIDPPRSGLGKEACQELMRVRPAMIAYVSCDPMTLKRDLEFFKKLYSIEKITGYDFFPQTGHIETLAVLRLR